MIAMIARLSLLGAAGFLAAALVPMPASAQGFGNVAQVVVYGNDPCPRRGGDEIVICARKPESERFRVPKELRDAKRAGIQSWADRATSLEYVGAHGTASCSPVGAGGWTGCQRQLMSQARAERQERKQEAAETP
jgi:hypothetical protein